LDSFDTWIFVISARYTVGKPRTLSRRMLGRRQVESNCLHIRMSWTVLGVGNLGRWVRRRWSRTLRFNGHANVTACGANFSYTCGFGANRSASDTCKPSKDASFPHYTIFKAFKFLGEQYWHH